MEVKIPTVRRTDSLYAKLGGKDSLEAVAEEFYRRVLADPELAPRFAGANAASLKSQQVRYLASVLGGPAVYHGETGGADARASALRRQRLCTSGATSGRQPARASSSEESG